MESVNVYDVFTTKEVAQVLDLNPDYTLRVVKLMIRDGSLNPDNIRQSGKRTYIFNKTAIKELAQKFKIELTEESFDIFKK